MFYYSTDFYEESKRKWEVWMNMAISGVSTRVLIALQIKDHIMALPLRSQVALSKWPLFKSRLSYIKSA